MTKQVLYKYLGTNGVIESPVHLEDIYYVRVNVLIADKGKILSNGIRQVKTVKCSDEEVSDWKEIPLSGQN